MHDLARANDAGAPLPVELDGRLRRHDLRARPLPRRRVGGVGHARRHRRRAGARRDGPLRAGRSRSGPRRWCAQGGARRTAVEERLRAALRRTRGSPARTTATSRSSHARSSRARSATRGRSSARPRQAEEAASRGLHPRLADLPGRRARGPRARLRRRGRRSSVRGARRLWRPYYGSLRWLEGRVLEAEGRTAEAVARVPGGARRTRSRAVPVPARRGRARCRPPAADTRYRGGRGRAHCWRRRRPPSAGSVRPRYLARCTRLLDEPASPTRPSRRRSTRPVGDPSPLASARSRTPSRPG